MKKLAAFSLIGIILVSLVLGALTMPVLAAETTALEAPAAEGAELLPMPESLKGKTFTWYVGYSPGGSVDLSARTISRILNEQVGINVVVENIEGGSASIAMIQCLTSPPDGTSIYSIGSAIFAMMGLGELEYKVDDITWIHTTYSNTQGIFVRSDSPIKTLKDFEDAIRNGNPGDYPCGIAATVNPGEAMILQLDQILSGGKGVIFPVNFPGGSRSAAELLGGNIEMMVGMRSDVVTQLANGEVRQVFSGTYERMKGYENEIPAITEAEFFKGERPYVDYRYMQNFIIGPKDIPEDIVAWMAQTWGNAINSEEFRKLADEWTVNVDPMLSGQEAIDSAQRIVDGYTDIMDRFYR